MARYPNGRIPDEVLTTFKTGWNSAEGTWKHQLTPGSYAKHLRLVALAEKRTGRTLTIGDGWGAYRPIHSQEYARKKYGTGAAVVGTSSHGGDWYDGPRGWRESMAMDYDNWGWVYDWDRAAFYEDVRAAGLEPGLIHPSRGNGYPDEPWHVVDLDPWAPAPSGAGNSTEDDMTPEERKMLKEVHSMLLETRDYLGARGGHNTKTPNTIGHKVTEIRDYLGAGGAKGNRNEATLGHKINALFAKFGKTD